MKQKVIFTGFMVFLFIAVYAFAGNDPFERLDNSIFENPHRPGAVFMHDDHNYMAELEDDCTICHHLYEDGELIEGESSEGYYCSDCHFLKPDMENSVSLQVAYHKRCRSCHFEKNKGPVLCGECHKK